jgi:hypothetical protein
MAELYYNDGVGVRKAKELYYNDGVGVRTIKEAWYNDGVGVRKVYASGAIVGSFTAWNVSGDTAIGGGNSSASLTFASNGAVSYIANTADNTIAGSTAWFAPATTGIGSSYWIRATVTAGTLSTNPATTWTSLGSGATFVKGPSASGSSSCTVTFQIASDSGGVTVVLTSTGNVLQYTHT